MQVNCGSRLGGGVGYMLWGCVVGVCCRVYVVGGVVGYMLWGVLQGGVYVVGVCCRVNDVGGVVGYM